MTNSKKKGSAGERELSRKLRDHGYDECRRTEQYCGKAGDSDVVGLEGIHIECKRVEHLMLDNAMAQAKGDAIDGNIPTVMHRKNRGEWLVTMRLDDWVPMYRAWAKEQNNG